MSISVEKTATGFAVKFPFELKDNFKEVFRSAKWNPAGKCWEVGVRSQAKLNQWVEAVTPAVEDIEAAESEELTAAELARLQAEIANVRADIAKNRREKEQYGNTAAALIAAQEDLAKATVELSLEKSEKSAKAEEAREIVSRICDLNAVYEAKRTMIMNHGKVGSKHREAFNDACSVIGAQHKKLLDMGFRSAGLSELHGCNFNRPERDNPRSVSEADIFNIKKVE